jgi:hypothetical protein
VAKDRKVEVVVVAVAVEAAVVEVGARTRK